VSIFELLNAVNGILKRFATRDDSRDVYEDKFTVSEKIEHLAALIRERVTLRFSELFADATSRSEVVVTFLALLELIRLKQLLVTQAAHFGEIDIQRAPEPSAAAPAPSDPLASEAAAGSHPS
jgi:segregation and condensation protein A